MSTRAKAPRKPQEAREHRPSAVVVSARLRAVMDLLDVQREWLARKAGVKPAVISHALNPTYAPPSAPVRRNIETTLDLPDDYLDGKETLDRAALLRRWPLGSRPWPPAGRRHRAPDATIERTAVRLWQGLEAMRTQLETMLGEIRALQQALRPIASAGDGLASDVEAIEAVEGTDPPQAREGQG